MFVRTLPSIDGGVLMYSVMCESIVEEKSGSLYSFWYFCITVRDIMKYEDYY